jgi:hypothetical protein
MMIENNSSTELISITESHDIKSKKLRQLYISVVKSGTPLNAYYATTAMRRVEVACITEKNQIRVSMPGLRSGKATEFRASSPRATLTPESVVRSVAEHLKKKTMD